MELDIQNGLVYTYLNMKLTKEYLLGQISESAKKSDLPSLFRAVDALREVVDLDAQEAAIEQRKREIEDSVFLKKAQQPKLRKIYCQTTGGCLRQNLLTLTRPIQLGKIKVGERLCVTLPDGSTFNTDVSHQGNKLRERGEIARFYRDYNVREGDYVVLEETSVGKWNLRKQMPGEKQEWI